MNNEINKNKKLIIMGVAMFISVLALIFAYFVIIPTGPRNGEISIENQVSVPVSATRVDAPVDIVVPEMGVEIDNNLTAVPVGVIDAAPGGTTKLRSFDIRADGGRFIPSTVIVNQGDTVNINFTAVDGSYDITIPDYGIRQTTEIGETRMLEFLAINDGKFTFYCELCGGIDSDAKGFIIIRPSTP